tara:strand:- start:579 stop:749 length:171 start_codon:yes stop_codon:yes gene_type:complete
MKTVLQSLQAALADLLDNPVSPENNYHGHKRYMKAVKDAEKAIKDRIRYEESSDYN